MHDRVEEEWLMTTYGAPTSPSEEASWSTPLTSTSPTPSPHENSSPPSEECKHSTPIVQYPYPEKLLQEWDLEAQPHPICV